MRIAMVVSAFPKLSETFILDQITGLLDLGCDVEVFSLARPNEEKVHPDVERYRLLDRTVYGDRRDGAASIANAVREFSLLLLQAPATAARLAAGAPRKHGLPHRSFLAVYAQLVRRHARRPFDIIHCHFGPVGLRAAPVAAMLNVPLITCFHGYDAGRWPKEHGLGAYAPLFERGALFLAVSEFIVAQLGRLGCPDEKIGLLPISSSMADIGFRERHPPSGGPVRVLTIARLAEKKGLPYSISAIGLLRERGYEVECAIAGDGPLRPDLERLIGDLGLEGVVHLLGWQDRPAILALLEEAHVFVLSSVTASDGDHEGMPVVLREAQAAGLPTVTSNHAGNPEAIVNGESGFVVPERDPEALAERLAWLIDHPEVWPEFGRRGRRHVEEHFDMRRLNRRLVGIYEDVVAGRLPSHD